MYVRSLVLRLEAPRDPAHLTRPGFTHRPVWPQVLFLWFLRVGVVRLDTLSVAV